MYSFIRSFPVSLHRGFWANLKFHRVPQISERVPSFISIIVLNAWQCLYKYFTLFIRTALPVLRLLNILNISFTFWILCDGRDKTQSVSLLLPTAAALVRSQVRSRGIFGGRCGTDADFLRVVRFPLPILIPPTAPYSSIIRGWYKGPTSVRVPSGLCLTPLHAITSLCDIFLEL
jgi:hypothetical protein